MSVSIPVSEIGTVETEALSSSRDLQLFIQVILPLLKSDLYEVIQSTLDGLLSTSLPVWLENHSAVTVVMASKGYPGAYTKGVEITGEEQRAGQRVPFSPFPAPGGVSDLAKFPV